MHFVLDRRRVYGENALERIPFAVKRAEVLFSYLIW